MIIHLSHMSQCFSHFDSHGSLNSKPFTISVDFDFIFIFLLILASYGTGCCVSPIASNHLCCSVVVQNSYFILLCSTLNVYFHSIRLKFCQKMKKKSGWSHRYMLLMHGNTFKMYQIHEFWIIEFTHKIGFSSETKIKFG